VTVENPGLQQWARRAGEHLAGEFLRLQERGTKHDPEAFMVSGIDKGGPLLRRLREHAEVGFRDRLAEIGGAR
jgi:hypothetical protein